MSQKSIQYQSKNQKCELHGQPKGKVRELPKIRRLHPLGTMNVVGCGGLTDQLTDQHYILRVRPIVWLKNNRFYISCWTQALTYARMYSSFQANGTQENERKTQGLGVYSFYLMNQLSELSFTSFLVLHLLYQPKAENPADSGLHQSPGSSLCS